MIKENFGIRKSDIINRRMFIIGAAKLVIFGGIVARLFSLQINDNKKYLTLSDKNRIRESKLHPVRGEFRDYFGNVKDTKEQVVYMVPWAAAGAGVCRSCTSNGSGEWKLVAACYGQRRHLEVE